MNFFRKKNRLPNYDYSSNGAYFITFCTQNRQCVLGQITDDNGFIYCKLSQIGIIVDKAINDIHKHYTYVQIPCYCIMPNHVHIVLSIAHAEDRRQIAVATIIGNMKRAVSMQLGKSIWQPSYYDHVVRNEDELNRICEYIDANSILWEQDKYFV